KVCADKPENPSAPGPRKLEGASGPVVPAIDSEPALIVISPALPVAPGLATDPIPVLNRAPVASIDSAPVAVTATAPASPGPRVFVTISPLARIVNVPVLIVMSAAFAEPPSVTERIPVSWETEDGALPSITIEFAVIEIGPVLPEPWATLPKIASLVIVSVPVVTVSRPAGPLGTPILVQLALQTSTRAPPEAKMLPAGPVVRMISAPLPV